MQLPVLGPVVVHINTGRVLSPEGPLMGQLEA
jgi:hypothetical protein